jgi:PhnB protein
VAVFVLGLQLNGTRGAAAGRAQEGPMAIKRLNPYLNFNGTAEKAIKLYESVLGARTEGLMRFGDAGKTHAEKDRVMHALLHLGEGIVMISDTMASDPVADDGKANVHITLDFDDPADMARKFEGLASGGKITMPLQDTFWGARFGMLTDAYGIRWMFNCELRKG